MCKKHVPQRALQIRGKQALDITEDLVWGIAGYETEDAIGPECKALNAT